jgi:hypothetical protein
MVTVRVRSERIRMASSGLLRGAGLAGMVGGVLIAIADLVAFLGGVYAATAEAAGLLGLMGLVLAFLGVTMLAGLYWAYAFVVPPLRFVPAGLVLPALLSALGWLLFGVATLRGGVYPRPAALVLIIGAALSAIPAPATEIVLVLAIAWLGYHLFSGRGAAVAQTPPRVG